uniref:Uncharacterized protein n=1 Tax=Romanomermis culicivorax TaxID=13658 RepID=A0A915KEV4_ROMCU
MNYCYHLLVTTSLWTLSNRKSFWDQINGYATKIFLDSHTLKCLKINLRMTYSMNIRLKNVCKKFTFTEAENSKRPITILRK